MPQTSRPYRLFTEALNNLGFYNGMVALTLATIALSPPAYLLLRRRGLTSGQAVRRIIWWYGRGWINLAALFVSLHMDTGTTEDYPRPCILVANHQSFFDAFCMGALPIYDLVFAVRAWPFRIPFYGPYMRRGEYLNSEELSCETFLGEARERLERGISLVIFPEGTRSPDGELGRFYSGAFKLAVETGTPLVPLCITGTGAFLPKGRAWIRRASIRIKKMAPICPSEFAHAGAGAHIALRKHVKHMLREELRRAT